MPSKTKLMILIDQTLISDEVLSEQFVCNLSSCKGICCVEGYYGAPLDEEELESIEKNMTGIRPFMTQAGLDEVDKNGIFELDDNNDYVTATLDHAECVFAVQKDDTWMCAIEMAHKAGKSDFLKPISCHLYPIRITKTKNYDALNYDRWDICSAACTYGKSLNVPVYRFLKDSLTRKYGAEWYEALDSYYHEKKQNEN